MNLLIQLFIISLCYIYSKSIYIERGVLLNLFFINSKNKYKNNENWTLLIISLAEIVNINKYSYNRINNYISLNIEWDYLYWWLLCISIINIYTRITIVIYCILILFPIQLTYLQNIFTILYIKNILLLLIKKKYYRLLLIFIKSVFNFDIIINRIFYKKETTFISWIYNYIPFYNSEFYEYVSYNINSYIDEKYIYIDEKYIYNINIYSNNIVNNINNYINNNFITEVITLLRIIFLFYYNYYVYKLDL